MTKAPPKSRVITIILFALYAALLIAVIIFKFPFRGGGGAGGERFINLIPFAGLFSDTWRHTRIDIIYNTLVFVPFGVYISMLLPKSPFKRRFLLTFALTLVFESVQLVFAIGRCDITDLITNTAGGVIGMGAYAASFFILKNKTALVINTLAALVTAAVLYNFMGIFYRVHFVMSRRA